MQKNYQGTQELTSQSEMYGLEVNVHTSTSGYLILIYPVDIFNKRLYGKRGKYFLFETSWENLRKEITKNEAITYWNNDEFCHVTNNEFMYTRFK